MANPLISFVTRLLRRTPGWTRDLAVTIGGSQLLRQRRAGHYKEKLAENRRYRTLPRVELLEIQRRRLHDLIERAAALSPYYREKYKGIDRSALTNLPILEKEDLHGQIDRIIIGPKKKLLPMFTGGTTGRGIVVYNKISNMQERFAIMDVMWETFGFKIGRQRIAWFSGRTLLEDNDVARHRFWRTNWLYKARYYSTFHLAPENLPYYVENLNRFRPEFFNTFPSAIIEVARFIEKSGIDLTFQPKAIFVTSETLYDTQRELLERVFRCPVVNQYASSEGAPFIIQCPRGNLHIDPTTGVFEVVDDDGNPSQEGEVIVTCFTPQETPIIRYRIGDRVRLAPPSATCPCGWGTPLAEAVLGRSAEFIEIPGRGRLFNAQIVDCLKDVTSVTGLQVEVVNGRLEIDVLSDREVFESRDRTTFLKKVRERVGSFPVEIFHVDSIPRAPSGKQSVLRKRP